ncbi:hypothetical protein GMOD_00000157 [Pyrenophora seminiperda CCB06]|uniref:Uncharacterized protein n=1 Tax=Pyrenophora seminiperda CCB06 TaxID=1302712 RepID=A0A3M7M6I4_9PLEO|nr:hypothetical protein GMOD_00000157 [Pyrenophora seminiperda CCB06]
MSSYPPLSPSGLPSSPRVNRQMQMLSPIETSYSDTTPRNSSSSPNPTTSEKPKARDIFAEATIPLSPATSASSSGSYNKEDPYAGLAPRKRSGFARLFCCLGREERARRRADRHLEFVKVGEEVHWTEY